MVLRGMAKMINLGKHKIVFQCPSCGFSNNATIKQVRLNDILICRGCKRNIRMVDHSDTTKKALRSFSRAIREFEEQIKRMGEITIKL